MNDPGYALLVAGPDSAARVERAISAALPVKTCPGVTGTLCPVLQGGACSLRENARVTLVYLAGDHEFFTPGQWECVTASTAPAVVVLEGSSHPPSGRDGFAIVGAEEGPLGILAALAATLDRDDTIHQADLDRSPSDQDEKGAER